LEKNNLKIPILLVTFWNNELEVIVKMVIIIDRCNAQIEAQIAIAFELILENNKPEIKIAL
jgi:hypothetical protein